MQVSVEKVSNVLRRLTITVPVQQVEAAYVKHINEYAKHASVKGFRPGKVPMTYIKQRFGEEARKEALGEVMQNALHEAIVEHQLKPISMPRVEPKHVLADQPFEFVASFEVLPELDTVHFKMDQIEKILVDIKPDDIDYVISQLKKQHIKWHPVTRAAQKSDRLVIDYEVDFEEAKESDHNRKIEGHHVELGSKMMIPGFEEGLMGATIDEERTLNLTFPEDFAIKEQAGKPVQFKVKVKSIQEPEEPALDEEFVKKLGIATGQEEELKSQIQKTLSEERDRLVKEKLKEQVFQSLLEQNSFEIPESLVKREAHQIHDEIYGQDPHHQHQHSDKEMESFDDIAKKRVALGILVAEYAKKTALKVESNQIIERIQSLAAHYEHPQEVIAWLSSKERVGGIEAQILEDLVLDTLIKDIPVTEKVMSYAELKGIRT